MQHASVCILLELVLSKLSRLLSQEPDKRALFQAIFVIDMFTPGTA